MDVVAVLLILGAIVCAVVEALRVRPVAFGWLAVGLIGAALLCWHGLAAGALRHG